MMPAKKIEIDKRPGAWYWNSNGDYEEPKFVAYAPYISSQIENSY